MKRIELLAKIAQSQRNKQVLDDSMISIILRHAVLESGTLKEFAKNLNDIIDALARAKHATTNITFGLSKNKYKAWAEPLTENLMSSCELIKHGLLENI